MTRPRRRNRVARFMAIAGGTQALYAPGAVPGSPTFHITTTAGARRASLTWEPTNATVCVATRQAIEEHVTLLNDLEEARAQVRTLTAQVRTLTAQVYELRELYAASVALLSEKSATVTGRITFDVRDLDLAAIADHVSGQAAATDDEEG